MTRGRQVTVVGRRPAPAEALPEGVKYITGDYGDRDFLSSVLHGTEEIVDLAYATVPHTSFENPVHDIIGNLPAFVSFLEVASGLELKKLVVVSSGGVVYGITNDLPISETHPTNPISPYGITKLAVEKYAYMFHKIKDLPVVCVRPSNAYGQRQRPFAGQGFVATAMASVLKGLDITIYGEKGTVRDYIHVIDVAGGIVSALDHGAPGSLYNIGTGEGRSNYEVLDSILSLAGEMGLRAKIKVLPTHRFDVPANVLDSRRIREETGWSPSVPFEDGIRMTWRWYCKALR